LEGTQKSGQFRLGLCGGGAEHWGSRDMLMSLKQAYYQIELTQNKQEILVHFIVSLLDQL